MTDDSDSETQHLNDTKAKPKFFQFTYKAILTIFEGRDSNVCY